jgi:hypothetical protein
MVPQYAKDMGRKREKEEDDNASRHVVFLANFCRKGA